MAEPRRLERLLRQAAAVAPERPVAEDCTGRSVSYGELAERVGQVAAELARRDVGPTLRVGIWAEKSVASLAALLGTLEAGATYVPVDASAPPARNAEILADCSVSAVVIEPEAVPDLLAASALRWSRPVELAGAEGLWLLTTEGEPDGARPEESDLAYVLYTSGSTGGPKGVAVTHAAALHFVDWCVGEFAPTTRDVFSSLAPLHFDLSIFDLFVALRSGASILLIDRDTSRVPGRVAERVARSGVTVWYSTPTMLRLLALHGGLERYAEYAPRLVLFAGEVFPPRQLGRLRKLWPGPRYYNLYGPTETNVCTYYPLPRRPLVGRDEPLPIGRPCAGTRVRLVGASGSEPAGFEPAELWVSGPTVMRGYWRRPELDRAAFVEDSEGGRWFRTGDWARRRDDGQLVFCGRRDRMVKRHGHRIELDEIESSLAGLESVQAAAVFSRQDEESGARIEAALVCSPEKRPSLQALKAHCGATLPAYMTPDRFRFLDSLPRTSTGKTDYRRLAED